MRFILCALNLLVGISIATCQAFPPPGQISGDSIMISWQTPSGQVDTFNLVDIIRGADQDRILYDQNGIPINYDSLANKVILLDFWFLACPPCIVELPGLELLDKKVASTDFVLLTFAQDSMEQINGSLLKKRQLNLRIIAGASLVGSWLHPFKLVYDKDGRLLDSKTGGSISNDSIQKLIDKYYPLITSLL